MIIVFHIHDGLDRLHRISVVCGPSTTAAGAINRLRAKLSIPPAVVVEVHLANDVPIRHLTAPLTSLRKQRSGSIQVLRMQLWASLTGSDADLNEINYQVAEVVLPGESMGQEDEEDEEVLSTSVSERRSSTGTSSAGPANRIRLAAPHTRPQAQPVQAKAPQLRQAVTPATIDVAAINEVTAEGQSVSTNGNAAVMVPAHQQLHSPRIPVNGGARKNPATQNTASTSGSAAQHGGDSSATGSPIVIKRRSSPTARSVRSEVPLSAREPQRRPMLELGSRGNGGALSARGSPSGARIHGDSLNGYGEAMNTVRAARKAAYARRFAVLGQILVREYPKVVQEESKDIVLAVHQNVQLMARSYNRELEARSDCAGIDDATYAQCLSIGLTYGQRLRVSDEKGGTHMALYGELSSMRHSCCPTAVVQYDLFTAPHAGSCRCAAFNGIQQGEEITYLYKHADSLAFLLLSPDRRRNILQRKYFFECSCARCTEVGEEPTVSAPIVKRFGERTGAAKVTAAEFATRTKVQREAEMTLTGAFFTDSDIDRDAARQAKLMQEMRSDFDHLQIMDDTGVEINLSLVGNVPPMQRTRQCNRLLGFLRKFGSSEATLRLHDHHWRLNLTRAAYIQETVRLCAVKGATPEARMRDPDNKTLFTPTKTVYDMCLKQLAIEALFVPAGHPHSLTTYESFLYLLAVLPPVIAQSISRTAKANEAIKWKRLEQTKETWTLLKRAALPPPLQQYVSSKKSLPVTPVHRTSAAAGDDGATKGTAASPMTAASGSPRTKMVKRPPNRQAVATD